MFFFCKEVDVVQQVTGIHVHLISASGTQIHWASRLIPALKRPRLASASVLPQRHKYHFNLSFFPFSSLSFTLTHTLRNVQVVVNYGLLKFS